MTTAESLHSHLKIVKELVYDKCGLEFTNLALNAESIEYGACSFELNGNKIQHRVSKITQTKAGQFVTIWKRNEDGITQPFGILDDIDFMIISSKSANNFGLFIFPKSVLADNGVITQNGKEGKRGIRVYPPWDIPMNRQAAKTQNWQAKNFVTIKPGNETDLSLMKKFFIKN